jgi:spore maturation protein CgeB
LIICVLFDLDHTFYSILLHFTDNTSIVLAWFTATPFKNQDRKLAEGLIEGKAKRLVDAIDAYVSFFIGSLTVMTFLFPSASSACMPVAPLISRHLQTFHPIP